MLSGQEMGPVGPADLSDYLCSATYHRSVQSYIDYLTFLSPLPLQENGDHALQSVRREINPKNAYLAPQRQKAFNNWYL